ncbi:MAG: RES family NAD+ phosphorylase [Paracoccaceae bacterium]
MFCAAEPVETAAAEVAFWRLLFFVESPETPWPANPLEFTAFAVGWSAGLCLDLTRPPYADRHEAWIHPTDYAACHAVADEARVLGADAIRSISARDPAGGRNVSLLSCATFVDREPRRRQGWRLKLSAAGVYARCEEPRTALHFDRDAFLRDPRIAALRWERPVGG